MRDCLMRGESPYASHLLYTQRGILRDEDATERMKGILAGLAWGKKADLVVFYIDRGMSGGMKLAHTTHRLNKTPIEYRTLTNTPERVMSMQEDLPV